MRCSMILAVLSSTATICEAEDSAAEKLAAGKFAKLVLEFEQDGEAREYAGRFLEFAKQNSKHPAAVDALVWVINNVRRGNELPQAIDLLAKHHGRSDKLLPICRRLTYRPGPASERLLRTILDQNPLNEIKAHACHNLAVYLQRQLGLVDALQAAPDRKRFEQFYGKEFTDHLAKLDRKASILEIEKLYERLQKSFA
ncbi:MAG: hypothetical protein O3A00_28665, partial [Planctomycetota bacterium]|nr:hypothetical protein [Planctomycetota bacterium]